ncbi:hypothetical protein G7054_g13134 [Neopestalotiopsis clavispora]|nr:hypothetical protein G7054_g13134 [Neopestalotiopsis clavispora]
MMATQHEPEQQHVNSNVIIPNFDTISMLAMSLTVLGTWATFALGLSSGLINGGPSVIIYGLFLVTFCNVCVAISLAELFSSMPTALGQGYWVGRLLETRRIARFSSYMCSWINVFAWWTMCASGTGFLANLTLGMRALYDPEYKAPKWLQFVAYLGITILLTLINAVGCRKHRMMARLLDFNGIWYLLLLVSFSLGMIVCIAVDQDRSFQPVSFVFATWINNTGWSDGVVWFCGLVQAAYGLTAFDCVIHMAEEIPDAAKNVPKVLYLGIIFGAISGMIFMIVCLFCIQDLATVMDPRSGLPFMELVLESVGQLGSVVLLSLFVINIFGQGVGCYAAASRLTWSFAHAGGIPFHRYLAKIDLTWRAPVRAQCAQAVPIALVGLLYLFADTVLQAILSVCTVAYTISYVLPIIALLWNGREKFEPGPWHLGRFGPVINWVSVIYCLITSVFFCFPSTSTPKVEDMNYSSAVLGILLIFSIIFWFVHGHKTFVLPGSTILGEGETIPRDETNPYPVTVAQKKHSD